MPLGKGHINVAANVVAFYVVAAPVVAAVALTDAVTTDVASKMVACVGLSSIAQTLLAIFGIAYLCRSDWIGLGKIIQERANSDRLAGAARANSAPASPAARAPEPAVGSVAPLQAASAAEGEGGS